VYAIGFVSVISLAAVFVDLALLASVVSFGALWPSRWSTCR